MDMDADVMFRSLIDAARTGDYGRALQLIRCGVNVNGVSLRGHGYPIMEAARNGHTNVVSLLLENGAEVRSSVPFIDDSPLIYSSV